MMKFGWMVAAAAALLVVPAAASADQSGKAGPNGGGGSTTSTSRHLGVKRLVLAHGIDAHEPQDAATSFKSSDDRIYAFVELENPGRANDNISVVFEPPSGPPVAEIPLSVGDSARFRTWAFTRKAHVAGEWTVVIRDGQHKVLARQTFTVT